MKKSFSDEALAIWAQIINKNRGYLNPTSVHNFVDILSRELGLEPVMIRRGKSEFVLYDEDDFRAIRIKDFPDGFFRVLYTPGDCEAATGSGAHNWTQWANLLLNFGRRTHDLAPWMRPPKDVLAVLESKGQIGEVKKVTRFLSLEVVVFYLATQTRTWGRPSLVLDVKALLNKNGVSTVSFVLPTQDPVDVDDLFPPGKNGDDIKVDPPKTSVPKAGRGLVTYNPTLAAPKVPAQRQPVNAPPTAPATDLADIVVADTSAMSDEDLDAHIKALQAALEERRARARKAKWAEWAAKAVILHGDEDTELWADRPQYATVTLRYPDGEEVSYYHKQLVDRMVGSAGSKALAEAAAETDDLEVGDLLND